MKKIITRIDEFLADTKTKPVTAPPKPGTKPNPPGIAPTTRPSVDPRPLAAKDVVNRFMEELKNAKQSIKFDVEKLKKIYGK